MRPLTSVLVVGLCFLLSAAGCKKDNNPAQTNNTNTNTCNFTTDVIAVDGTTRAIIRPVCHVLGTAYFAEFHTDTSAAPTGVAMIFSGTTRPAPGTYTPVNDVNLVAAGKVYVEYYDPANAWQATTGTVTVAASGSQVVITFCNLTLSGAGTKVVSVRATTNL
jgi:hypothetical protein